MLIASFSVQEGNVILTGNMDWTTKEMAVVTDVFLLYAQGIDTFTIAGFCKTTGHKDNRHTRRMINGLVRLGLVFRAKQLFTDGHYRMMYANQKTVPMKLVA